MTATCGIQKFRWREKNKHLSKYWGSSTQDDPCRSNIGGGDPCNPCGVDAYGCGKATTKPRFAKLNTKTETKHSRKTRSALHYSQKSLNQLPFGSQETVCWNKSIFIRRYGNMSL